MLPNLSVLPADATTKSQPGRPVFYTNGAASSLIHKYSVVDE